MEKKPRRGGLVWPIILIGLGVVFLLNNLGVLPWDIWGTLLRMWPVILIAIGLDLIIGWRSVWGSLVALVLIALVLAGGIWLAYTAAGPTVATTETVAYPLGGATQASVEIAQAVGELRVRALPAGSANLAQGTLQLARGETVTRSFIGGDTARLSIKSDKRNWGPEVMGVQNARVWDLALNGGVPMVLELDLAVGKMTADLSGLDVSAADVKVAVGDATVRLPSQGRSAVKVSVAVGNLAVEIPRGVEARVRSGAALAGRSFPSGWARDGDTYTSPGYATAQHRVELETDVALGNLTVRVVP
ncbi:MAG: DUF5668 domain-containing protein [Anaerolineae bacterium]|nr:DUF5668 domain-containing protein [Anaerolineae bacterium]